MVTSSINFIIIFRNRRTEITWRSSLVHHKMYHILNCMLLLQSVLHLCKLFSFLCAYRWLQGVALTEIKPFCVHLCCTQNSMQTESVHISLPDKISICISFAMEKCLFYKNWKTGKKKQRKSESNAKKGQQRIKETRKSYKTIVPVHYRVLRVEIYICSN